MAETTSNVKRLRNQLRSILFPCFLAYFTPPCLLPLLQPIRQCLHRFLRSKDAVRFMRTGRLAVDLLHDYAFIDHAFTYKSARDVESSIVFYRSCRMRILCMCLPYEWNESLIDRSTGLSMLPASLVALTLGDDRSGETIVHAIMDGSGKGCTNDGEIESSDECAAC